MLTYTAETEQVSEEKRDTKKTQKNGIRNMFKIQLKKIHIPPSKATLEEK